MEPKGVLLHGYSQKQLLPLLEKETLFSFEFDWLHFGPRGVTIVEVAMCKGEGWSMINFQLLGQGNFSCHLNALQRKVSQAAACDGNYYQIPQEYIESNPPPGVLPI